MNTMRLAAALGICVLAASAGFIACGGDDSSSGGGPDSSTTDTGGGGNNDSGGGGDNDSGGGGNDAGGNRDAFAPDPGELHCNQQSCSTSGNNCCVQSDGGQACNANAGSTCSGSVEIHCDEKADCTGAQVCCGDVAKSGTKLVSCTSAASCSGIGKYQICKSNAECASGVTCKRQDCSGLKIQTCGGISGAGCTDL